MARHRMLSLDVIDTDQFLNLSATAQNLYFHLCMHGDDDGFVSSPRKIMKMIGATDGDMQTLISNDYVILFEKGIIVIRHWRLHNIIKNDRYHETIYTEEKSLLTLNNNKVYELNSKANNNIMETKWIQDGTKMEPEVKLSKDKLSKESKKERKISKSFDDLIDSYTQNDVLRDELKNHLKTRKQRKGTLTNRALELSFKKLDELTANVPEDKRDDEKIKLVRRSIENGWPSFFSNNTATPSASKKQEVKNRDYSKEDMNSFYANV